MLSEMTSGERNFALLVEHLLNKIEAPEYRQVNVEALMELAAIVANNPSLQIEEYIVLGKHYYKLVFSIISKKASSNS